MQGIWDPAVASGRDGESPPPPPDPGNEPHGMRCRGSASKWSGSATEAIECRGAALDRRVLAIPHPGVECKLNRASLLDRSLIIP
jgi:hypothetical protein